jgi:hypothetical protein
MINKIIELLRPYDIGSNKIRLGNRADGGYVLPEKLLKEVDVLYSYGIGNDVSFENGFFGLTRKAIRMYDHTIAAKPFSMHEDRVVLRIEGLSLEKSENTDDFLSHILQNDHQEKKILLKIDIEGYELEYFARVINDFFKDNVLGILVEVHFIEKSENQKKFLRLLENLKDNYLLNHIHGNNYCNPCVFDIGETYDIPRVLECTFVNRKIVDNYQLSRDFFPIVGLDFPNHPFSADLELAFLKEQ